MMVDVLFVLVLAVSIFSCSRMQLLFCRASEPELSTFSHDGLQGHDGQESAGCRPWLHRPQVRTAQPTAHRAACKLPML